MFRPGSSSRWLAVFAIALAIGSFSPIYGQC